MGKHQQCCSRHGQENVLVMKENNINRTISAAVLYPFSPLHSIAIIQITLLTRFEFTHAHASPHSALILLILFAFYSFSCLLYSTLTTYSHTRWLWRLNKTGVEADAHAVEKAGGHF